MIYRGMDKAALDRAYNIGAAAGIERRDRLIADWTARTAALAARAGAERDLRYGDGARNRLDFFRGAGPGAATLVFVHGGYWQFSDKENYGFLAAGPLAHQIDVALVEYTLAPALGIDGIVAEIRQALSYLRRELAPNGFVVAGHSAGAHLAAMAMGEPGVKGVLAISGLYDLEPIRLCFVNDKLGLDEAAALRNSPIQHIPRQAPPVTVAWGADELPELCRQSAAYCDALHDAGLRARALVLHGHDHFSLLEELASPDGKLTQAVRALA